MINKSLLEKEISDLKKRLTQKEEELTDKEFDDVVSARVVGVINELSQLIWLWFDTFIKVSVYIT